MRWVRLRASLPALLGGLRVAAPNAVLGAILAEFGSGLALGPRHLSARLARPRRSRRGCGGSA